MNQNKQLKDLRFLFSIFFVLLFFSFNLNAQITLLNTDSIKCVSNDYKFDPIFEQKFINDSILQIKTTALASCIGVNNPGIELKGPLLNLEFEQFKIDERINPDTHKRRGIIVADCNCVYQILWHIKGIKRSDKFIILLNRQISRDFDKKLLDSLLTDYEIDNNFFRFYLKNAIDKNGQKQGYHFNCNDKQSKVEIFKNGILQIEKDE